MNLFLLSAACVFAYMTVLFIVGMAKKDNDIADIGWGLGVILVTAVCLNASGTMYPKQKLTMFLVTIWGIRLFSYVGLRNWGEPEDFRHAQRRIRWQNSLPLKSFWRLYMYRGVAMLLLCLPIIVIHATPRTLALKSLYPIGGLIWAFGFFIEGLADKQLFYFKENKRNKGAILDKGLWRYSRHPNYFGEVVLWWGIFILSIPSGYWYISIWSPVLLTLMLLKVSGVAPVEKKYEHNEAYQSYRKRTPVFIPWFPKRG